MENRLPKARKAVWSGPAPAEPARPSTPPPARPRAGRGKPVEWLAAPDGAVFDLRRGRDAAMAERLVARAAWLPQAEAALVLAVFRDGQSLTALARVHAVDDRLLRRRLARSVARLLDARAQFVAIHAREWTPLMAQVGRFIYLHGLSMRETARRTNFTLHVVREQRLAIDAMFDAWRAAPRALPPRMPDRSWR